MAGVLTHFFNADVGEGLGNLGRKNKLIDMNSESTAYSGRVAYLNTSDMVTEGQNGPGQPLYFLDAGVEHPDVAGVGAVSSSLTGSVNAISGYGQVSLVPLRPGLTVKTSEYNSDITLSVGDGVACATGSGELRKATAIANPECLGRVEATPASVNGVNVITVEILRPAPGA